MKKFEISSLEELESIFKEKSKDMTAAIRDSIQEALEKKKKSAILFEIGVEGMDNAFEISLSDKEWGIALENCLKHYQEWEMADDAIDTWQLLQKINK